MKFLSGEKQVFIFTFLIKSLSWNIENLLLAGIARIIYRGRNER